jgi:teichuronic acid biosynthesis glycosyltransferase TuaG
VKVSLIIPYKVDRGFLQHALDSVEAQTYEGEIELIMSQSDNSGAYNFNRGVEVSTGEYIKYLCEDDWLTPNSIKDSVNGIGDADFIHGNAYNVFNTHTQVQLPKHEQPTLNYLLNRNVIHGGTLMYRRDVFERIGLMDESLTCAEEYEFNLRCLASGMKLNYVDSFLYNYRRHELQKSLGKGIDQKERQKKIQAIKDRYR